MSAIESAADNGVNVEALLDARNALIDAPEAAEFTWRASNEWLRGTHSKTTIEQYSGLGEDHTHKSTFSYEADHPEVFAAEDNAPTPVEFLLVGLASCLTAGVAAVAQNRGIQLESVKATVEGDMNILGILGADPEVRNGYSNIRVNFDIKADAEPGRDRRAGRPVAEALGRLRRDHEPDQRVGDGQLSRRIPVVIIGAGHAGLAVSRVLSERSLEHVVLERGEVANTWKTERWDSLRLLTPNWLTRLPGLAYDGEDPDGFMAVPELIEFLERYAEHIDAPVRTRTTVTAVSRASGEDYRVETDDGSWEAAAVVIASGAFNRPHVPAVSASLPA